MSDLLVRLLHETDRARLATFLAPWVDSSIFLLANSFHGGLDPGDGRLQGHYFGAFVAGELVAAAALYWNGNLVLQAPGGGAPLEALLGAARGPGLRPLKGILGPREQVGEALAALGLAAGDLQLDEPEGLYALALEALRPPSGSGQGPAQGRRATLEDLELLTAWRVAYEVETLNAERGPALEARARDGQARAIAEGSVWVLEDGEGRPVATSGFNARLPELVQVGGVYTPPELRGRGYARGAVAASLLAARRDGVARAVLFTGEQNTPAVRAYASLGFQQVGNYRIVLLQFP